MKATLKTWAAAMMVMLGMIPVGCGGSVVIGGQDPECPTAAPKAGDACSVTASGCAYQDGPCKETLSCDAASGAWQKAALTCSPAATDCWSATDGDVCAVVGESCGDSAPPCFTFSNTCGADHLWHRSSSGDDGGTCPEVQPQEGESCAICYTSLSCDYPGSCGGAYASCGPDGLWHVATGDCPPPPVDYCTFNDKQASCETDPGCRWLTPGCNPSGLTLTGCFQASECSPDSCMPGTTCQKVTYDPCFGKGCDACGAETSVCLQSAL